MAKLYESKAWLQERYRTMNAAQIAKICGVSEMTITRWLGKHNIPIRRSR
ncbi:helix-turn-helix DNA binding domain protein [Streptomyces phage Spilled]|uniref:Helix-turn-helix DNA binding domain protein n=4 Tax=Streptomyces virus Karimac TaxID=2846401 RepID=A0A5Q2WQ70_9CAUD|nr:DNA binding protein [Streptomyces phage Karimac]AXH66601.1 hypothetical protein SEA_STARBOW_93 [Streptomyces phage Starbow]QDF17264.1 hypothetical protein SEA_BIRCHLYN_92 [Streptomyces phage Birchlyn]QFP97408.1 helix-turn-helix DNA-binding protein [Streptomyces phage IchabodCrane]QGH74338.1 hypothetical protein SEA_WIPEOUT_92 [Streptomyces phage Wipeout]QGH78980.1 hypothetical protein SEA_TOMSAWYER_93 [Streptomyces phage TomSawyer]QGH79863.1 hypothetical protein SEA_BORDEAUX_93 [Streptomyc